MISHLQFYGAAVNPKMLNLMRKAVAATATEAILVIKEAVEKG